MHLVHSDFKKGIVKIKVEDLEDLWYLSHLIEPGDLVKGKTTRKVKIGENEKTAKKTYTVQIAAEKVEFGYDGTILRVNGRIKEGSDDLPKESYQAIALEEGTEFVLEKNRWSEYQKQKLAEASEKKTNYLICLFDREEVLFALTKKAGYKILAQLKGDVPKKSRDIKVKTDFQQEIIHSLETYTERFNPEAVILSSPAFYKEDLFKKINNPELKKKIVLVTCSDISESSLDEVVKKPELASVLKSSRARKEKLLIEELLSEINQDNLAVYGWEEVKKVIDNGIISKLLLTDDFVQKKREIKEYEELDRYMKQVNSLQGEIHIISAEHEGGKKLNGLGGIAALLRYKVR